MALPDLKVRITADTSAAEDALGRTSDTLGDVEKSAESARRSFARFAAGLVSVGAAVSAIKSVAAEATHFETTMLRINRIIKATGGAAGRTGEQLRAFARNLALNTLESTEGVLEAQQRLLTFRKVSGVVFDRTITAAADMAAAMGQDLSGAAVQLGRALEDPVTGMTALTRSGTVFTDAQKDMVKSLVESGQLMKAQTFILDELEAQYGGTAVAAAQGYAGALDTLAQRMQEMRLAANSSFGVTDMLTKVVNGLSSGVLFLTENMDRLASYAMVAAAAGAVALRGVIVSAAAAVWGLVGSLAFLRTALIRTGIGALIVGAGELVHQFRRLSEAAGGFGNAMGMLADVGREVFQRIHAFAIVGLLRVAAVFYDLRDTAGSALHSVGQFFIDGANTWIQAMAGAGAAISAVFTNITSAIASGVSGAINFVLEKVEALISKAVDGVNSLIAGINNIPGIVIPSVGFSGLGRVSTEAFGAGQSMADAFSAGAAGAYQIPGLEAPTPSGEGDVNRGLADALAGAAGGPLKSVEAIRDVLASIKEEGITLPELLGVGGDSGDGEGGSGSGGGSGGGQSSATKKLDEELSAQEGRVKEHFDRIRALTQGGLSDKLGAWGSYFQNLVSLTGSNNQKLLGIAKSFAAAQALIDAWSAHNAVLKDPTLPWWARVASAANVLAAGFGAVNAIKSISANGSGGGGSASAGGGASGAVAQTETRRLDAVVRIEGDSQGARAEIAGIVVEELRDMGLTSAQVFS